MKKASVAIIIVIAAEIIPHRLVCRYMVELELHLFTRELIVETAKANHLKVYEYLEYLLTEIPKHMDNSDSSFLDDLLPWSDAIPDYCRKCPQ